MIYFIYIKLSKNLWDCWDYWENKERLKEKLMKNIKIFLKKKKEKKQQYGCERYKNLSEDKKIKWLSKEKKYYKMTKTLYYNYK